MRASNNIVSSYSASTGEKRKRVRGLAILNIEQNEWLFRRGTWSEEATGLFAAIRVRTVVPRSGSHVRRSHGRSALADARGSVTGCYQAESSASRRASIANTSHRPEREL